MCIRDSPWAPNGQISYADDLRACHSVGIRVEETLIVADLPPEFNMTQDVAVLEKV